MSSEKSRRSLLSTCACALGTGIAGCLSSGDGATDGQNGGEGTSTDGQSLLSDATSTPGWSQYHSNAGNTGHTSDPGPVEGLAEAWSTEVFVGPPAIADGTVYASSGRDVVAVDEGGETLWRTEVESFRTSPWTATPTVTDGAVVGKVLQSDTAVVYSVDRGSGEVNWTRDVFATVQLPTVADGVVYVARSDGGVSAFDVETGDERWTRSLEIGHSSTPMVHDGSLYVVQDALYELDPASGETVSRSDSGVGIPSTTPSIAEGILYYTSRSGRFVGIDLADGSRVATAEASGNPGLAIAGDLAVFGSRGGTVYGVNRRTGETLWTFASDEETDEMGEPVVADATIYVPEVLDVNSGSGRVYALDENGRERWRREFDPVPRSPAVANGRLYAGDGYLTVFEEG